MRLQIYLILFFCLYLTACGGAKTVKPATTADKPATSNNQSTPASSKSGGYYLDDGPGDNPPQNIDSIPNAVPKKEPLLDRANRPYKALGATYRPMNSYQPYKAQGVASWYGKRYHGRKTSSGEVYDMYSMSAAHPTLPLPSYVKVTNPANGRFVIVRVNDRGPFKNDRIIDLSYAAAYKLRFTTQGSTLVQVEAIDTSNLNSNLSNNNLATTSETSAATIETAPVNQITQSPQPEQAALVEYFIQAGAFKNEANADSLITRIQALDIEQNAGINKVYNKGLHRLKLGPYSIKKDAELVAADIRKRLNIPTIITNQ